MDQTHIAISVNGLEKSYKKLKVLNKVHFSVQKGQIFALLGTNGAGKTTTIKILTTLLKPDNGNAQVGGFDVVRQPERVREEISLTGQFAALDEILTGRENLRMIGQLRHISDVKRKTEEMLERFDLLDAADRPAATYSGGMRRRLDLAMSLMGSPSILFLDEPTAGLDPQSRIAMWKIIKDLARTGTTVFLTTQYLEEADQLADQIAILNEGTIIAQGTAAELKKLLPHGRIELRFHDGNGAQAALDSLAEYDAYLHPETLTLAIITDGSARQMADILNRLEHAHIPIAEYAQKLPTLEDVFLAIIGDSQQKEGA